MSTSTALLATANRTFAKQPAKKEKLADIYLRIIRPRGGFHLTNEEEELVLLSSVSRDFNGDHARKILEEWCSVNGNEAMQKVINDFAVRYPKKEKRLRVQINGIFDRLTRAVDREFSEMFP